MDELALSGRLEKMSNVGGSNEHLFLHTKGWYGRLLKRGSYVRVIRCAPPLFFQEFSDSERERMKHDQKFKREKMLGDAQRKIVLAQECFGELRDLGIAVDANFFIQKLEDSLAIVGVSERVCESSTSFEVERRERETWLSGLLDYYLSVMNSYDIETEKSKPFLFDLAKESQYVFGTTKRDNRSRVRLVDIDPQYITEDLLGDWSRLLTKMIDFSNVISDVTGMVDYFEGVFGRNNLLGEKKELLLGEWEDLVMRYLREKEKEPSFYEWNTFWLSQIGFVLREL